MFEDFMVNTWIAATLVAGVAGIVGFFVVIRGASFAAHALPLSAFPGAAAANLVGVNPLVGPLVFSGLGVTGISQLGRSGRRDLATALSLVMLLGLGALFLSRTTEYFQAVYALLFGEVLGVSNADLGPVAVLSAVSVALILMLFRPLLLSSVSPDLGEVRGVSARLMEVLFLAVVALATAMALPDLACLNSLTDPIALTPAPSGLCRPRRLMPHSAPDHCASAGWAERWRIKASNCSSPAFRTNSGSIATLCAMR